MQLFIEIGGTAKLARNSRFLTIKPFGMTGVFKIQVVILTLSGFCEGEGSLSAEAAVPLRGILTAHQPQILGTLCGENSLRQ